MITAMPDTEAYLKTFMLRDETRVVSLRPMQAGDKIHLLDFFKRIPEEERFYLKENVTSPEVIQDWTANIDFGRVIPIVALDGDRIVADATLHRSRTAARRHVGEIRVVVDPDYREVGLGRRLIRELLDTASELGLHRVTFELVAGQEEPAINAARSVGFKTVAVLPERIRDFRGNNQDLVLLDLSLGDRHQWWY